MAFVKRVSTEKKKKPLWKKWLKSAACGMAILAAGWAFFLNQAGILRAERNAWPTYQRVVAGGTPLDLDAFLKSFEVPDDQNAAIEMTPAAEAFEKALDRMNREERSSAMMAANERDLRAEVLEKGMCAATKLEKEWAAVHAAAAKPKFIPKLDWSVPVETSFSYLSQMRQIAQHANLRATDHVRRGNVDGAVKELELMAKAASYAADTPVAIGQLVDFAFRPIHFRAVQRFVKSDPANSSRYASTLKDDVQPMGRVLRAETFFMVANARTINQRDLNRRIVMASGECQPGQPLRYQLEGNGFRLWSVGADAVDDGGEPSSGPTFSRSRAGGFDEVIVF